MSNLHAPSASTVTARPIACFMAPVHRKPRATTDPARCAHLRCDGVDLTWSTWTSGSAARIGSMKRTLLVLVLLVGCKGKDKEAKEQPKPPPAVVVPDAGAKIDEGGDLQDELDKVIGNDSPGRIGSQGGPAGRELTPEDEEIIADMDRAELDMTIEEIGAELAALDDEIAVTTKALASAKSAAETAELERQLEEMQREKTESQAKKAELEAMRKARP